MPRVPADGSGGDVLLWSSRTPGIQARVSPVTRSQSQPSDCCRWWNVVVTAEPRRSAACIPSQLAYLGQSLNTAMKHLCEILTADPEGGPARIPFETFSYVYRYLSGLDSDIPASDTESYLSSLKDSVSGQDVGDPRRKPLPPTPPPGTRCYPWFWPHRPSRLHLPSSAVPQTAATVLGNDDSSHVPATPSRPLARPQGLIPARPAPRLPAERCLVSRKNGMIGLSDFLRPKEENLENLEKKTQKT
ncbi:hypothetical protein J1605_022236 [Eschrichtius robustus]|uniref:Ropporin-1-like protein n=1 Tax=Eschrichtius robustus TaxID=9764 RepID=A0AB34HEE1_ESCRO|nr:hypothetical protein J1605_022236 [Eschrichtius robustus]